MAKQLHKFMDQDVLAFLRAKMEGNTQHYQSDFEVDKILIDRMASSQHQENKTFLWMSRPMGTQCLKESEAFIHDTAAHTTWTYFAAHEPESILAYRVEITGTMEGIIRGNIYELDYPTHAAFVSANAVAPQDVEKIFEDGFVDRVAYERSSYGYYYDLVNTHGPIVDSLVFPQDKERLAELQADQRAACSKLKEGNSLPLSAKIRTAIARAEAQTRSDTKAKEVEPAL